MTEATHVNPEGCITPRCTGMYSDENDAAMKRVIDFCRKYGVAAQGLQLGHAGRKASTQPPALGGKPLRPEKGAWQSVAPSALPFERPLISRLNSFNEPYELKAGMVFAVETFCPATDGVSARPRRGGGGAHARRRRGHLALSCAGAAGREQVLSARRGDRPSRP